MVTIDTTHNNEFVSGADGKNISICAAIISSSGRNNWADGAKDFITYELGVNIIWKKAD